MKNKLCDKLDCEHLEPIPESIYPYCHHIDDLVTDETYKNCKYSGLPYSVRESKQRSKDE